MMILRCSPLQHRGPQEGESTPQRSKVPSPIKEIFLFTSFKANLYLNPKDPTSSRFLSHLAIAPDGPDLADFPARQVKERNSLPRNRQNEPGMGPG